MKIKINDAKLHIDSNDLEPVTRRLEKLLSRTSATEATFDVGRIVRSGRAGISAGPLRDNESIPLSVQCGKGGTRYYGMLSSQRVHVAQLFQEFQGISDPCLKIIGVNSSLRRKKRQSGNKTVVQDKGLKVDKLANETDLASRSQPREIILRRKPAEVRLNLSSLQQPKESELQEMVRKLEESESQSFKLNSEIQNLENEKATIAETIAFKRSEHARLTPFLSRLHRLRKEFGLKLTKTKDNK